MPPSAEPIYVVDDDLSVRESVTACLGSFAFDARPFASAEAFLDAGFDPNIGCLILDISMPGMNGEQLQEHLRATERRIPIVFITACTEAAVCGRVLERGAVACLAKPFQEDELLNAVNAAIRSREQGTP
jgi:FixJ family two-component response regulator